MEFALIIYAIELLGNVGALLALIVSVLLMVSIFLVIYARVEYYWDDAPKSLKFYTRLVVSAFAGSALLLTALPSKQTAYLMLGAYASQQAIESKIGKDIIKLIELKVKNELEKAQEDLVQKVSK